MLTDRCAGPRSPVMINAIDVERWLFTRRALVKQFGFDAGRILPFVCGARRQVDLLNVISAIGARPVADPKAESSLSGHDAELISNVLLNQSGGAQADSSDHSEGGEADYQTTWQAPLQRDE